MRVFMGVSFAVRYTLMFVFATAVAILSAVVFWLADEKTIRYLKEKP